jgi:hypothetical protein
MTSASLSVSDPASAGQARPHGLSFFSASLSALALEAAAIKLKMPI